MAHHVYTTKGVVLKAIPIGESDKLFSIFTHDLGLISASAKSVRVEKSKLSAALQDFSLTNVSVVRGKHRWKITSAALEENFFVTLRADKVKLQAYARIAGLLTVLLAGEEKNNHLFEIVSEGFHFLKNEKLTVEEIQIFESILVLRILHNLGYVSEKEWYGILLHDLVWNGHIIQEGKVKKLRIVKDINAALSASQLS